jgi:hypothetical protein
MRVSRGRRNIYVSQGRSDHRAASVVGLVCVCLGRYHETGMRTIGRPTIISTLERYHDPLSHD